MLILHDPATLAHKTIELLGAKVIPALESPERIFAVLEAVRASKSHDIKTLNFSPDAASNEKLLQILSSTHDAGYLHHLEHAHSSWVKEGLVEQHESILPECFPFPNSANARSDKANPNPAPPKDIFARAGFYAFDMSTGICASTYKSALASAHLAFDGARILCDPTERPQSSTILALCRPPGHHCDARRAGGYCYINNAVVAIATFRAIYHHLHRPASFNTGPALYLTTGDTETLASTSPSPRIAILDLDFHHGNGTQEAFYADPHVLYISIHGQDEYPYYTGFASEIGAREAQGMNLNLPLPAGSSLALYLEKLDVGLNALVTFRPDFVVLSLGFDTFHLDPLGSFKIETEDYAEIAERVREGLKGLGRDLDEGDLTREVVPCLILLEGGYVVEKLGPNLQSFLRGWEEA